MTAVLLSLQGCGKKPVSDTAFVLDTAASVTLYDGSDPSLISGCFSLCTSYENLFSRTVKDSDIALLNSEGTADISEETASLLERSLGFCELSGGTLDITIGAVTELWDFHAESPAVPDETALENALKTVDFRKLAVDMDKAVLNIPGAKVDLGAVAKGWIADRVKEHLTESGVKSALIDLGGNILCLGKKPDGKPFIIGIRDPSNNGIAVYVELSDDINSVVTSGTYQRNFTVGGKFYHHIIDPETGFPAENELASVTILSKDSFTGDALSTACFVMGLAKGLDFIDSIDGVYAVFIEKDGSVHCSSGLKDAVRITE